jgi:hypothetical protein
MNLLFDFTVDKETATIYVTRNSPPTSISLGCFHKSGNAGSVDGPQTISGSNKRDGFPEGGRWLYCMVSPENVTPSRFSLAEFIEIHPKSSFTTRNSFADENGNPSTQASLSP